MRRVSDFSLGVAKEHPLQKHARLFLSRPKRAWLRLNLVTTDWDLLLLTSTPEKGKARYVYG